jgi:sulfite exporter TauE/SafE
MVLAQKVLGIAAVFAQGVDVARFSQPVALQLTEIARQEQVRAVIENCISVVLLALALVMAGSGHLPTFRLTQVGVEHAFADVLTQGLTSLQAGELLWEGGSRDW